MSFENNPLHSSHHRRPKDSVMSSSQAPKSTLATLLSSQRRSAVQSERHRVQVARPFAGSAQIENAAKRAAAQLFPQPPSGKNRYKRQGSTNIHQSSYNDSHQTKPSSESSRRVTFVSRSDYDSIPTINDTADKQPRNNTRLDEKICAKSSLSIVQQTNNDESTTMDEGLLNNKSILRKVDRSASSQSVNTQQIFISKISSSSKNSSVRIESNEGNTSTFIAHPKATSFMSNNAVEGTTTQKSGGETTNENTPNVVWSKEGSVFTDCEMQLNRKDPAIDIEPQRNSGDTIEQVQNAMHKSSSNDGQSPISQHNDVSMKKQIRTVSHEMKLIPPELALAPKRMDTTTVDAKFTSGLPKKKAKKKKKRFSPFRAKVGCVVAVRFRKLADGGNPNIVQVVKHGDSFIVRGDATTTISNQTVCNHGKQRGANDTQEYVENNNTPSLVNVATSKTAHEFTSNDAKQVAKKRKPRPYEFWSPPIPGKDDGLSLLGSWIKCPLPSSFADEDRNTTPKRTPMRTLEGNVISIENTESNESGIKVVLLVDRTDIVPHPNLQVLADKSDDATTSAAERKMRELEARIRGENKMAVQVTLASVFDQRKGTKLDPGVIKQWAVRKRVSATPTGKLPSKEKRKHNKIQSMFVGDGIDSQVQQKKNWKWIASRAPSSQLTGHVTDRSALECNTREYVTHLVGEVIKIDPMLALECSTTIATVTFKRLWTPEQLESGRLAHHGPLELFDSSTDSENEMYFQAPIEDLIVVGPRIHRLVDIWNQTCSDNSPDIGIGWNFTITHSFRARDNTFTPLCSGDIQVDALKVCHYCHRSYHVSQLSHCLQHSNNNVGGPFWCTGCMELNGASLPLVDEKTWRGPCCLGKCGCIVCSSTVESAKISINSKSSRNATAPAFADLLTSLQSTPCTDFILPKSVGQLSLQPSVCPLVGDKKSKKYGKETQHEHDLTSGKVRGKRDKRALSDTGSKPAKKRRAVPGKESKANEDTGERFCNVECIRAVSFDQLPKHYWGSSISKHSSFIRNKHHPRAINIGKAEEKSAHSGRAARASQRRMIKSLAALGDASKSVDRLAGRDREHLLRFDKSKVHGWGVYAVEQINAGDLIIEYRGEIIGNAVADKREKEYEAAKLDDYMFRIDAYTVCDATLLGNVARYINASCSPNCYTQIITAGDSKRIVIYAKRDIKCGEELCYDYKFALEFDPAKRIPCHCGSADCRGFMNWVSSFSV